MNPTDTPTRPEGLAKELDRDAWTLEATGWERGFTSAGKDGVIARLRQAAAALRRQEEALREARKEALADAEAVADRLAAHWEEQAARARPGSSTRFTFMERASALRTAATLIHHHPALEAPDA